VKNSIGCAISVKTNDPTFDPEAAVALFRNLQKMANVMKNLGRFMLCSGPVTEDLVIAFAA